MSVIMAKKSYEPCYTRTNGKGQYTTCRGAQKKRAKAKAKAKPKSKMILPSRKTVSASKSKSRRKQIGVLRIT